MDLLWNWQQPLQLLNAQRLVCAIRIKLKELTSGTNTSVSSQRSKTESLRFEVGSIAALAIRLAY